MKSLRRLRLLALGLSLSWIGQTHLTAYAASAPNRAAVDLDISSITLTQIGDTAWSLKKQGSINTANSTVTWEIAAEEVATVAGQLVISGEMKVRNTGSGPAPIGNIVVNLQTRFGSNWTTQSSNIADATYGDDAITATIVKQASSEGQERFMENAASGPLNFMDASNNTLFSLIPQAEILPGATVPLLFQATFDNNELQLPAGTQVRIEVIVSFGNSVAGGNASAANVDINGNGTIDAYEARVRSVPSRHGLVVPAQLNGNSTVTLTDTLDDITTTGTVTFGNAMFNLGATSGTVSVTYDGGASGGTITNCAHLTGQTQTVTNGGFTFPLINGVDLEACDTQAIDGGGNGCTPGAPGCGWKDGDMITYGQTGWGDTPAPGNAAALLVANYNSVYASTFGVLMVGLPNPGFSMRFSSASAVLAYLPAVGTPAALTSNLVDPTSSSSGSFGGDVTALRLNIDFSDAGVLAGASGLPFGNLRLCGLTATPALNGLTVRQFSDVVNTLLGGGSGPYLIATVATVVGELNRAFGAGNVTAWAQDHVVNGAAWCRRHRRRRAAALPPTHHEDAADRRQMAAARRRASAPRGAAARWHCRPPQTPARRCRSPRARPLRLAKLRQSIPPIA
jgi:hypothetical protein